MNPFRQHILDYVNSWKCITAEQLRSQKFVERGFYNEKVCGSFAENLDILITEGIIRRAKFQVGETEIAMLMPNTATFKGWC